MIQDIHLLIGNWFDRYVTRWRNADGLLPDALELKYHHSLRVAENARLLAGDLRLDDQEILLAHACGLLHDIGRFVQYHRYGSFRDADTLDHGLAGKKELEAEGASSLFEESEWIRVACAVEYHNRKTDDLPDNLPADSLLLLKIIRDADKLDILDLVLQSVARDGFSQLPDMLPHIRASREVSPSVMEEFRKTQILSTGSLSTVADFLVLLASWFYDFNFSSSVQIAVSRNLLIRLQRELPDIPFVRELLADINEKIERTNPS